MTSAFDINNLYCTCYLLLRYLINHAKKKNPACIQLIFNKLFYFSGRKNLAVMKIVEKKVHINHLMV